jgi:hypothetical protein
MLRNRIPSMVLISKRKIPIQIEIMLMGMDINGLITQAFVVPR